MNKKDYVIILEPIGYWHKTLNSLKKSAKNIEEFRLLGLENEFVQALINILNNAKDALIDKGTPRLIFIDISEKNNKAIIKITDNGGGIDEKIIDKVCEPYFTTKHQSQGTGIGLYMTEEIIVKHMHGEFTIKNVETVYKNITYKGAQIIIGDCSEFCVSNR